jgi:hypothetical protein
MNVYCLLRQGPVYRREAFVQGLAAAGLNVSNRLPRAPGPEDVLVIWNRYAENDALARRFEDGGGRVIVAENGYLGYGGRTHRAHDTSGRRMYALALHDHNGRGAWPAAEFAHSSPRFPFLGVEVLPWTTAGAAGKVLVCAQRGIGSPGRASPPGWAEAVARELRKAGWPSVVRAHPGDRDPAVSLEQDLAGAQACVIWASGAGVKALVLGVPVFHACPWWVCSAGARRYTGPGSLVAPVKNDLQRAAALERMAWAQWTCEEIASGEPFRRLLAVPYPTRQQEGVIHA